MQLGDRVYVLGMSSGVVLSVTAWTLWSTTSRVSSRLRMPLVNRAWSSID
jgi:hypothetical protein